jgi:hypothetical protein
LSNTNCLLSLLYIKTPQHLNKLLKHRSPFWKILYMHIY